VSKSQKRKDVESCSSSSKPRCFRGTTRIAFNRTSTPVNPEGKKTGAASPGDRKGQLNTRKGRMNRIPKGWQASKVRTKQSSHKS